MNTIFEILQAEHRRAEALMGASAVDVASLREGILTDLWELLQPHMRLEEELVYPILRDSADTTQEAQDAFREHREVRTLIVNLEGCSVESQEWETLFERMQQQLRHHFREEENLYFAGIRRLLDTDDVTRLTQRYLTERSRPMPADLETTVELSATPESTEERRTW